MDKLTGADRELFCYLLGWDVTDDTNRILEGAFDSHPKMQRIARHRLAAQAEPREWRVPEGWKLVPSKPNGKMMVIGCRVSLVPYGEVASIYAAMLAAAPEPPAKEAEGGA